MIGIKYFSTGFYVPSISCILEYAPSNASLLIFKTTCYMMNREFFVQKLKELDRI
jgi:hypothetical protein